MAPCAWTEGHAISRAATLDRRAVRARLRALASRAERAVRALDLEPAAELYDAAHVLGVAADEPGEAAVSLAGLAHVAHLSGDLAAAQTLYARALETIDDTEQRGLVRTRLGFACYDRGDLASARAELELVLADARSPHVRARALGFLGNVARAEGDAARALTFYEQARSGLAQGADRVRLATFAMDAAVTRLLAGDAARSLVELEVLLQDDQEPVRADPHLRALVQHYAELARVALGLPVKAAPHGGYGLPIMEYLARLRVFAGDASARARRSRAARDELARLYAQAPDNAHARIGLALLERLRRRDADLDPRALVAARTGAYFRLGANDAVILTQRIPLQRLVVALTEARLRSPGVSIDAEQLVERGWPGERLVPAAKKNRLHVAIATLRELGLRSVLETRARGYRIDPDVRAIMVD